MSERYELPAYDVRAVVFEEAGAWVVQGLELDTCAQGPTKEEAKARFRVAIAADLATAKHLGKSRADIGEAPAEFWRMWNNAP